MILDRISPRILPSSTSPCAMRPVLALDAKYSSICSRSEVKLPRPRRARSYLHPSRWRCRSADAVEPTSERLRILRDRPQRQRDPAPPSARRPTSCDHADTTRFDFQRSRNGHRRSSWFARSGPVCGMLEYVLEYLVHGTKHIPRDRDRVVRHADRRSRPPPYSFRATAVSLVMFCNMMRPRCRSRMPSLRQSCS